VIDFSIKAKKFREQQKMRAVILGVLLSATVISSFTSFCDTNKNDNYVSTFSEEFDGEILDETVWSIIIGSNVGACRSAMCTTKNVYLEDGQLVLRSLRSGKQNFTTGAIWSMNKTAWRVGEVRNEEQRTGGAN